MAEAACEILIVGAGTGGCAAAMAARSRSRSIIWTDAGSMRGGQLTSQMVPPDEHRWIEEFGCTARYRFYRNWVRSYDRSRLNRAAQADPFFNPGGGWVSRLCHRPEVGLLALEALLPLPGPGESFDWRPMHRPVEAVVDADCVKAVRFETFDESGARGEDVTISAKYILDATELGDLLPLARAEYRVGSESATEFGEPHATEVAEPENVQGFTWCFALAFGGETIRRIEKPKSYDFWRTYQPVGWPGPLFSFTFPNPIDGGPRTLPLWSDVPGDHATLFAYRQIVDPTTYRDRTDRPKVACVNWPQNDYFLGTVIDVPDEVQAARLAESKELGLCLLYWLQNEAPRHDGGTGYPELTLRPDVALSNDGCAVAPYFRESRRMVTRLTVTEQMVSTECNPGLDRASAMPKSVGVGQYRIDLHPSANGRGYVDIDALPFQIPLGALIPVRLKNLLPAGKNLGVTHIANGCYRLHPVEWNVGEAAGLLAAFCVERNVEPAEVYERESLWIEFGTLLHAQGIEPAWPDTPLA